MGRLQDFTVRLRRNPIAGHIMAVAGFGVGLGLRAVADPVLPPGFPFLSFFPVVIIVTFLAGLWPGIVAAGLSVLGAWYYFIPPVQSFAVTPGGTVALGFFICIVGIDIAVIHIMNVALERLDAERRRSARLSRQSQVMFAELQHRVSNNLQLVSALLTLQQSKVSDPAAQKVLEDARARVATLGRLHRMLHDPGRQEVDIGGYLRELCGDVIVSSGAAHVRWEVKAEPVAVPPDKLVPLALIVAELVSNSLEHAFPDGRPGKLSVSLGRHGGDGGLRLAIRDDGPGLPAGFVLEAQTSLGLRIVQALAAQLDGRITMSGDGGTLAVVEFRV